MLHRRQLHPWILLAALAVGCPADDSEPCECDDDTGDDDVAGECEQDDECSQYEICEEGSCVDGDRNNALDEGPLLGWGEERAGWINPAGDVDFYRLDGEQALFFRAQAVTLDGTEEGGLDTVLRFHSADGTELGYNDTYDRLEHLYGTDAIYLGCTPRSQAYYLSVLDHGTRVGDPDLMSSGSDAIYTVQVDQLDTSEVEFEPNDEIGDATDGGISDYNVSFDRAGVISAPGDVDLWRMELEAGARLRLYAFEHTATEINSRVRILAQDGISEMAVYDSLDWTFQAGVPLLDEGPIFVEVGDRQGSGSDEHCYVLHLAADPAGEVYVAETEPNDEGPTAEPLAENDSDLLAVAGRIAPVGDVDHFVFQVANPGDGATISLQGRSLGSALAAHVSVLGPDDSELAAVDVSVSDETVVENLDLDEAGTYHVVVSATDPGDGGFDHWYGLFVEIE